MESYLTATGCHLPWDHTALLPPTQVSAPRLNLSHRPTGRYSIYCTYPGRWNVELSYV